MTCTLQAAVYDKSCVDCMVRKVRSVRSANAPAATKQKQREVFQWMGNGMTQKVLERLRNE